ncbi:MAG TPA: M48 family metallopeptidase [Opitutus sp.]|nr:M48 family metallopeptidase [Opitutus sp.]
MDFFEAQARAKKRTTRLVVLFSLAVLGTVLAAYLAAIAGLGYARAQGRHSRHRYNAYYEESAPPPVFSLWQPGVLAGVAIATLAIVGVASLVKWNEFSSGGSAVAESVGGRRVDPHTQDLHERRLLNVVEEMAIASGVPVPAVYILDHESALNAFAAGLTTSDAVVTVTRGTLEKLNRDELQGVIGHEFSHILNGDMRLNLRITAIIFGILVLGLAGRGILWSLRGMRVRGKGGGGAVLAIVASGVALLIIGYVGYFFGRLIQAAVSRQREFLADASSVQFTRNPAGIEGALKKIGGYALGSNMENHQAAAIGHFFFTQAFRSNFTGLWATHPPLDERIRAIDPQWDGKMFEPPEKVDITRESFRDAGFPPPLKPRPPASVPLAPGLSPLASTAVTAVVAIGTLTPEQISNAQTLLDSVPARLRDAAHSPAEAPILLYGLLLSDDPAARARQRDLISTHAAPTGDGGGTPSSRSSAEILQALDALDPFLRQLKPEHNLPLLQLALPALRQLPPAALSPFLDTLDELVHADGRVTTFEFALQKLLTRTLALGRKPTDAVVQIYSFNAVTAEIGIVLSALAHASSNVDMDARAAFAAGTAQLPMIVARLTYLDPSACDFGPLDAALDKLATASLPIKQRTILAAAHVVGADGRILVCEAELLRAISAALDIPMPPLTSAA